MNEGTERGRRGWPWLATGLVLGVVAGVALGQAMGHDRLRTLARRFRRPEPPPVRGRDLVRRARAALRAEPALAELPLEVVPVGPGTVELHGWVATRTQRAHAARTVRAATGVDAVINCILVHGEDDLPAAELRAATDDRA